MTRMDDLRKHATRIAELREERDEIDDQIETHSTPIERAAYEILKARHAYTRSGQWPSLSDSDRGGSPLNSTGARFEVTNSIDHGDDFSVTLTWDELATDPTTERRKKAEMDAEAELAAAKAALVKAQQRFVRARAKVES